MRRFYSKHEMFDDKIVIIGMDETRHIRDVLRLRAGAAVNVFDGEGREFSCEIETIEKKQTRLTVIEEISPTAPESMLELTVAAALLKNERFDLVVQKSVELGVNKLIPIETMRSDLKIKQGSNRLERWRKIALEATKQCGRAKLMLVETPVKFENILSGSDRSGIHLFFSERGGGPLKITKKPTRITAVYGPVGGWEDSEIMIAADAGFLIVTFGGRILRAETAAIAITAILQNRFGDVN